VGFINIATSPIVDQAFCFMCHAFGGNKSKTDIFLVTGFANWKKATEKFNEHQKSTFLLGYK